MDDVRAVLDAAGSGRAVLLGASEGVPMAVLLKDHSVYAPRPGEEPPEPEWKSFDAFKDVVHPRQPTFKG
jgi:hypothetical protein